MVVKPRKHKLYWYIIHLIVISQLAAAFAAALDKVEVMDANPLNWTVEQDDLANLIESTYDTVINNDLSETELTSLAGEISAVVENC